MGCAWAPRPTGRPMQRECLQWGRSRASPATAPRSPEPTATKERDNTMGEARRLKLSGTYPERTPPLSRSELIAWGMEALATTDDATVTGMTIIPGDGGPSVYLPAAVAKRPPGR